MLILFTIHVTEQVFKILPTFKNEFNKFIKLFQAYPLDEQEYIPHL